MVSASGSIVCIIVLLNVIVLKAGFVNNSSYYWFLLLLLPLSLLAVYNIRQKEHTLPKTLKGSRRRDANEHSSRYQKLERVKREKARVKSQT